MDYRIIHGDSREVLPTFDADSLDACVTDPPYELAFMGKKWDATGIAHEAEFWCEVLRVLKPGAHVVAFGGTRTFHRLAIALEDAGFEIRDCLSWLYGSGFPKSLDVSKAIDKLHGATRPVVAVEIKSDKRGGNYHGASEQRPSIEWNRTSAASAASAAWDGYGTALKPAWESIILARKPNKISTEWHIIGSQLLQLEARLWSLLPAKIAIEKFGLNQAEYDVACDSARWTADEQSNTRDALYAQMDTSQFVSAIVSSLNTVSSWRRVSDGLSREGNTFITAMASSMITDSATWKCCLSAITPESIILAHSPTLGSTANAFNAVHALGAIANMYNATRELSALEPVISQAVHDYRDGDGLSPNWEPIILARKPLSESSVAKNVLRWGTGALNIDGCRIEAKGRPNREIDPKPSANGAVYEDRREAGHGFDGGSKAAGVTDAGRWPASVCLDEEAASLVDEQSGKRQAGASPAKRGLGSARCFGEASRAGVVKEREQLDSGGASRFFYTAKPGVAERDQGTHYLTERTRNRVNAGGLENDPKWAPRKAGNSHPTVKPVSLMQWLVRMVTAPGHTILDPFLGSGTTMMAAIGEDRGCIGVEQDEHSCELAEARASSVAPLLVTVHRS